MNIAAETTPMENVSTPLELETTASNIIDLSEQGLLPHSSETQQTSDSFVDHYNSPLNEW